MSVNILDQILEITKLPNYQNNTGLQQVVKKMMQDAGVSESTLVKYAEVRQAVSASTKPISFESGVKYNQQDTPLSPATPLSTESMLQPIYPSAPLEQDPDEKYEMPDVKETDLFKVLVLNDSLRQLLTEPLNVGNLIARYNFCTAIVGLPPCRDPSMLYDAVVQILPEKVTDEDLFIAIKRAYSSLGIPVNRQAILHHMLLFSPKINARTDTVIVDNDHAFALDRCPDCSPGTVVVRLRSAEWKWMQVSCPAGHDDLFYTDYNKICCHRKLPCIYVFEDTGLVYVPHLSWVDRVSILNRSFFVGGYKRGEIKRMDAMVDAARISMLQAYANETDSAILVNTPCNISKIRSGCIAHEIYNEVAKGNQAVKLGELMSEKEGEILYKPKKPAGKNPSNVSLIARKSSIKMIMNVAILISCANIFEQAFAACLPINNVTICNFTGYKNEFKMAHSVEGPYLVCWGDECVSRCRKGEDKHSRCGTSSVYPYQCPTIDWEPSRSDQAGCSKCKHALWIPSNNKCVYNLHKKRNSTEIYTLPSCPLDYVAFDQNGELYIKGYKGIAVFDKSNNNIMSTNANLTFEQYSLDIDKLIVGTLLSIAVICGWVFEIVTIMIAYCKARKYNVLMSSFDDDDNAGEQGQNGMVSEGDDDSSVPMVAVLSTKQHKKEVRMVSGGNNWWRQLMWLILTMVLVKTALADTDPHTWQEYLDNNRTFYIKLPSVCSCNSPGQSVSQLRCITGCNDVIQVMNMTLRMHFDLNIVCYPKKLYVLDTLDEVTCQWCPGGKTEAACKYVWGKSGANADTWMERSNPGVYSSGCTYRDCWSPCQSAHRIWWFGTIYDAELCFVTDSQSPYIEGLSDQTAYTYYVHSVLKSQSSYVKVHGMSDGLFKAINGGIGSDRAWLVEPDNIIGNHVRDDSYLYQEIVKKAYLKMVATDADKYHHNGFGQFNAEVFSEDCKVDVSFSSMHCYTYPEVCTGECRRVMNVTEFKADDDGQCNGVYVSKDFWQVMPSGVKCDDNCRASKRTSEGTKGNCDVPFWREEQAHTESKTSDYKSMLGDFEADQTMTYTLAGISGIAIVLCITLGVILVLKCACNW